MAMEASAADRVAAFAAVSKTVEEAEDWVPLPDGKGESEKAPTQAAILVQLAMTQCDKFFHDENREAYAIMLRGSSTRAAFIAKSTSSGRRASRNGCSSLTSTV